MIKATSCTNHEWAIIGVRNFLANFSTVLTNQLDHVKLVEGCQIVNETNTTFIWSVKPSCYLLF